MKKYLSMLAFAAGSFMLGSCSSSDADEEIINNDPKVMSFKVASPSASVSSRAKIENINATPLYGIWEAGDELSVFGNADNNNHKFTYVSQAGAANSAKFEGTAFESDTYYLLYPYQENASINGVNVTATIPTVQKATKGSFDPKAALCGNRGSKDANIILKHACAFLMIETEIGNCDYIKIEPIVDENNPWYFTGGVVLEYSSSGAKIIKIDSTTHAEKYAMLTADGTEGCTTPFPPGKYLIAIASSDSFPKFKVSARYTGKSEVHSTSTGNENVFTAGSVCNLGTVPYTLDSGSQGD